MSWLRHWGMYDRLKGTFFLMMALAARHLRVTQGMAENLTCGWAAAKMSCGHMSLRSGV